MNSIRKYLGILWMAIGLFAGYYLLVNQAIPKFQSPNKEDLIPAIIYSFLLMPIITGGMLLFGWYAFQGEFDRKD